MVTQEITSQIILSQPTWCLQRMGSLSVGQGRAGGVASPSWASGGFAAHVECDEGDHRDEHEDNYSCDDDEDDDVGIYIVEHTRHLLDAVL